VEGGALAGGAGGPDAASVVGDDAATDGEAEAGAAERAGVGGVALAEAVEDVLELVFGDAAALIADFNDGFVFVEIAGGEVDLAAGGGELDGVGDEVVEGLKDAVGVCPDGDAVGCEEDAGVGPGGARLLESGGAAEEVFGAAQGGVELAFAAADALEIEDVVDEADEAVGVVDGDLKHLLRLVGSGGECAAGEQA